MIGIGIEIISVTISNGTSLSAATGLGAKTLVGIAMPAGWDAATLTFQASTDGVNWLEIYGTGTQAIAVSVAAGQVIAIDPTAWRGLNYIKVRSGTSSVPVNQTADRILGLVVRPV